MSVLNNQVAIVEQLSIVPVRELMRFKPIELLNGLKTNMIIRFEDNIDIPMTYREVVLCRYLYELFEMIPTVPIISTYSISKYYTNGIYTAKTLNKCLEVILEDIVIQLLRPNNTRKLLPVIYERMQYIFNDIYNHVVFNWISYASSINIGLFLELQFKPELIQAMRDVKVKKDVASVTNTYKILDQIMYDNPQNSIARGYVSGTINPNQIKQMLASRGYVTEIDSNIFKYPVASSFVLGMSDLYELAIESRAGAKALFLSNTAVQESEYFAREMHLVTMVVEHLVDGDCGNNDYMDWYVRPALIAGKSDISNLIGKRYLNKNNVEEIITKNHTHLEGTIIKLRVAYRCRTEDKNAICTACFGELAYGVHKHSNLGHFCSTSITEKISQSILSTKHLSFSAASNDIALSETAKQFFVIKNNSNYAFKAGLLGKAKTRYKMIVTQSEAFGIKDLPPSVNVNTLDPKRVSRIETITIVVENGGKEEYYPIPIRENNKFGSFTYGFLRHILQPGMYILDDYDRYIIDLNSWTTTEPIIHLPQLEYNYLLLSKNTKSMLKHMNTTRTDGDAETQTSLHQKLFDVLNTKLDVNSALVEVVVYAMSVTSVAQANFDLARNTPNPEVVRIKGIIGNRSLGSGYGWEEVISTILSPRSFNGVNAINHPLDVMVKPNETILDYYGTVVN